MNGSVVLHRRPWAGRFEVLWMGQVYNKALVAVEEEGAEAAEATAVVLSNESDKPSA